MTLITSMSECATVISKLMHKVVKVNGVNIIVMMDTRTTHTFVSSKLVHKYRFRVSKCPNYLKKINTQAQVIIGMTYELMVTVGQYNYRVNMIVISSEEHNLILIVDIYKRAQLGLLPYLNGVIVMYKTSSFIPYCLHMRDECKSLKNELRMKVITSKLKTIMVLTKLGMVNLEVKLAWQMIRLVKLFSMRDKR